MAGDAQSAEDVRWDYGPDPVSAQYRSMTTLDLRPLAKMLDDALRTALNDGSECAE